MANRIQPHPNPPYLKSDGTLNVSGQLKLYAAGTSTPKVAYSDAAGTSYGSTIDLDSSGLPESGPIYWDTSALYKVEVYTRTDDTPTYALDYTVDSFGGEVEGAPLGYITEDTTWTVDGVGATSTTFTTVMTAFDKARQWTILDGTLTIAVNAGTWDTYDLDVAHPQGKYIQIVGASESTTILRRYSDGSSGTTPTLHMDGSRLKAITDLTLRTPADITSNATVMTLENGAVLDLMENVTLDKGTLEATGIMVASNSYIYCDYVTIDNITQFYSGITITTGGRAVVLHFEIKYDTIGASTLTTSAVRVIGNASSMTAYGLTVTGKSGDNMINCVHVTQGAWFTDTSGPTLSYADVGIQCNMGGSALIDDANMTPTGITLEYDPALNTMTGSGSADAGSKVLEYT